MKRLFNLILLLLLTACAPIAPLTKLEGEQMVNNHLLVTVDVAWNRIPLAKGSQPFEMWIQEGYWLDHLRLWGGLEAGEAVINPGAARDERAQQALRSLTFQKGMAADQVAALFEALYTHDGLMVEMQKLEPYTFAGVPGVRMSFKAVRKGDNVHLLGTVWASVHEDRLYAAAFVAPRLGFYPRLLPRAEAVVASARIRPAR